MQAIMKINYLCVYVYSRHAAAHLILGELYGAAAFRDAIECF